MFVGAVLGITQTDVKRMLAYSSIAHAGFILTAFVAAASQVVLRCKRQRVQLSSVSSVDASTWSPTAQPRMGAFAIVTMVRDSTAARPPCCPAGPDWADARR